MYADGAKRFSPDRPDHRVDPVHLSLALVHLVHEGAPPFPESLFQLRQPPCPVKTEIIVSLKQSGQSVRACVHAVFSFLSADSLYHLDSLRANGYNEYHDMLDWNNGRILWNSGRSATFWPSQERKT